MKRVITAIALTAAFSTPAWAASQTVTLSVSGMYCVSCAITLKQALKNTKGVNQAKVSFETKQAVITFDDGKTDVETITLAMANAGYPSNPRFAGKVRSAYDAAKLEAALESLSPETVSEWQKKAEAGDPIAQNLMGMAYKYGRVIQQDHALSLQWFHKAAEQGDADAQFNLGRIYGKAIGVYARQRAAPHDDVIAASWYRKAAEQNYPPAQFNLAEMYAEGGPSYPRDIAQAYFWMSLAARSGDPNAMEKLKRLESNLSVSDRNSAKQLFSEWKRSHRE